jgi:hypothetical protein
MVGWIYCFWACGEAEALWWGVCSEAKVLPSWHLGSKEEKEPGFLYFKGTLPMA